MGLNLRRYLAIALSVMLIFTSHSLAVARGMPGPDGQMVICTGQGPVMISVDANGNPTGPAHICPDAALSLLKTAFAIPEETALTPQTYTKVSFARATLHSETRLASAQARGPPLTV